MAKVGFVRVGMIDSCVSTAFRLVGVAPADVDLHSVYIVCQIRFPVVSLLLMERQAHR